MNLIKKYKSMSLPIKASIWFTICNFILKAISFITVPLFTRYLSTEEYGIVSIFDSYQQIFLIFATLELSLGAYQRGILKFKNDIKLFTEYLQFLSSCITVVLFIGVIVFNDFFTKLTDMNITILSLMFTYFLVQPAYNCWINKRRFNYDYKPVIISTLLFTLLSTGISLIAVIYIKQTAIIRITSMLVVQILFCLPFYLNNINFKLMYKNRIKIKEYWLYMLGFQLPLVLHSLSFLILAQLDRIIIGSLVGKSEAALYSVAYSLSNVVIIFQTSINQVLKPWRYQKMEEKNYSCLSNITNVLLVIFSTIILMFILIAPEVMKLLFNKNYYEAVWTIPPVAVSIFFIFLYTIFTDIESYFSRTQYIMYASIICAIVNICLNYIGIYFFGYISCGYATLISYVLFVILHYYFMIKVCRAEGLNTPIFNKKFILGISIVLIVLMVIFTCTYNNILLRYCMLVVLSVICIIKRNKIIKTFSILMKKGSI